MSPVLEYAHGGGNCAVIGGFRYRGAAAPGLAGTYLYADSCSGRVWGASQRCGGSWRATELFSGGPPLSAFGEDEAGELAVVEWALGGARVLRVEAEVLNELAADSFEAGDLLAWQGCAGDGV